MSTIQLKECGKVLISTDHRLIVWECFYCQVIHQEWENFIDHVKKNHKIQTDYKELQDYHIDLKEEKFEDELEFFDINKYESIIEELDEETVEEKEATESTLENFSAVCGTKETSSDCLSENLSEIYDEVEYVHYEGDSAKSDEMCINTGNHEISLDEFKNANIDSDIIQFDDYREPTPNVKQKYFELNVEKQKAEHYGEEFFNSTAESEVLSFIEIIKQHPSLWTTQTSTSIIEEKIKSLKEMGNILQMSQQDIIETINYMITWINSEYNRYKDCISNNLAFTSDYPKYFDLCKFLISTNTEDCPRKQRKKYSSDSNDFKCPHCGKIFSKIRYLTVHIRRHNKEFSYKCDFCDKRTVNSTDMKTHMRVHTGEKPYVCEFCGKSFKTCSIYNAHKRTHDVPKFKCELCSKSYYNSTDLKNHMNVHLNKRDYKCQFCIKAFTSAKLLNSHKKNSHSTLKKAFCKLCLKCFTNINDHLKDVHEVVSEKNFSFN